MAANDIVAGRLAFSGTYNFVDDSESLEKYAAFVALVCADGGLFFPDVNRRGGDPIRAEGEIARIFSRASSDNWVGRLVIEPVLVHQYLENTASSTDSESEWGRRTRAWLDVSREYPELWLTLDFPG